MKTFLYSPVRFFVRMISAIMPACERAAFGIGLLAAAIAMISMILPIFANMDTTSFQEIMIANAASVLSGLMIPCAMLMFSQSFGLLIEAARAPGRAAAASTAPIMSPAPMRSTARAKSAPTQTRKQRERRRAAG